MNRAFSPLFIESLTKKWYIIGSLLLVEVVMVKKLLVMLLVICGCSGVYAQEQDTKISAHLDGQIVSFQGSNLPARTQIFETKTFLGSACGDNTMHQYAGVTNDLGTFFLQQSQMCAGTYSYLFEIAGVYYTVVVTPPLVTQPLCVTKSGLQKGSLAIVTRNAGFWMLPSIGPESHNGNPLRVIPIGDQMRVIEDPICNIDGTWLRVRYAPGTKNENIGWIRESVGGILQLGVTSGSTLESRNYPELSQTEPEALSLLSIGIRMRSSPDVLASRVGALHLSDGPVKILGRNGNGAFILVQNGTDIGWVCTHLTINTLSVFKEIVPVVDASTNECFLKK